MIVPVLLYHAVTETPGDLISQFSVSPKTFEQQMNALLEEGYTVVTFSNLLDRFKDGSVEEKTAVITFDDGYADFADNALPIMQDLNLVSTMYLTTGFLRDGGSALRASGPSDKMLSWNQINELVEGGTEIGAHSHSHPQMDTCGSSQLRDESLRPKELLEDKLQQTVRSFAYPHGYNGPRVQAAIRAAKYETAAGVRDALTNENDDRLNVARLMVRKDHSMSEFRSWLRGQAPVAERSEHLKTKGWRTYRRAKALINKAPGSDY